jgi:hypothetical protein
MAQWVHFKAFQFLRDVMEPRTTLGNIAFILMCNDEQQKLWDEEIRNIGESHENEAVSVFSEDVMSQVQDPALTAYWRALNRKRETLGSNYQEEILCLCNM